MNLTAATTRVRLLVNEKSAAQWQDAEVQGFIKEANNEVFSAIAMSTVDYFHKRVRVTYPAETFGLTLDTATDNIAAAAVGRWERILAVFALPNNAAASSTNKPVRVEVAEGLTELWNDTDTSFEDPYTQDGNLTGLLRYRINQRSLILAPYQKQEKYLWIHLIPRVFEPTTGAHNLLSVDSGTTGELEQHHDVICLIAAIDMLASIKQDTSHLQQRLLSKRTTMIQALGLQQQVQSSSRVVDVHSR